MIEIQQHNIFNLRVFKKELRNTEQQIPTLKQANYLYHFLKSQRSIMSIIKRSLHRSDPV